MEMETQMEMGAVLVGAIYSMLALSVGACRRPTSQALSKCEITHTPPLGLRPDADDRGEVTGIAI